MKIKLIKLKFVGNTSYKYKPFKYCCDAITKNKTICFTNESPDSEFYGVCDDGYYTIPYFASWFAETVHDWEDEWENDYYYPIKFCPHCGEPIEIVIVGEEDRTEEYLNLKKERGDLRKKCQQTGSKKKEFDLELIIQELDKDIEWFYLFCEYKSNI